MNWLSRLLRRPPRPSNNYSPRAQKLLGFSRQQADRLHHGYVGTEHLLLGLLQMEDGIGVTTLQRLGLNFSHLREEAESRAGIGSETMVARTIPITPAANKALKLASVEASAMGHTYVGTEHILLGLLRLPSGIAPAVLKKYGADLPTARLIVTEVLQQGTIIKLISSDSTPEPMTTAATSPAAPKVPPAGGCDAPTS